MKRLLALLPLVFLLASVAPYRPSSAPSVIPARSHDGLTIYSLASIITGAPEDLVKGFAFAESSFRPNPEHPDPADKGMFGLHETPEIHAERARKWGEYDALNPTDAAIIAGRILMDNFARLGDMDLAIAAYRQGVAGVRRDGATGWYVARVRKGAGL